MPKGIIEFNLPEEQIEYEWAISAPKYQFVIREILENLRDKIKYKDEKTINTGEFRDYIYSLLSEEGISHLF